jgi:hypothetical protein
VSGHLRIPAALTDLARWLLWKYEMVKDAKGNDKETKVPYGVGGRRASTKDPRTWSTYECAGFAQNQIGAHGLGFVFSDEDDIFGIDLDHVRDPETRAVKPWALGVVDRVGSYTELSPSGTGFHVYLRGKKPAGGCNYRFDAVTREGFEWYESGRFFTVSGNHLAGTPLEIRKVPDDELAAIEAEMKAKKASIDGAKCAKKSKPEPRRPTHAVPAGSLANDEMLRRMFNSKNGATLERLFHGQHEYASASEADLALCGYLAFWTGRDPVQMDRLFRACGLMREKWDEIHGQETYGATTIAKACAGCQEVYSRSSASTNGKAPSSVGALRATKDPSREGAARIVIDVTQMDTPALTKRAIDALVKWNNPPTFFRQNADIVRWSFDEFGRSKIKPASVSMMLLALAQSARYVKYRKEEFIDVEPPRTLVESVLVTPQIPLPGLRGLAIAPFFTASGELIVKPGYDASSQVYLALDVIVPEVPGNPTKSQFVEAVDLIKDLFLDFPFKGDADRAHAVALLLLPFVREMIIGPTPLHVCNAPEVETGKTLLVETALLPGCGHVSPTTFGRDEAEQGKKLIGMLKHGRPAALFDNLKGTIDSAPLEAVITSYPNYSDRVLGGNDSPEFPNRATWVVTSNNAKLSTDLVSRSVSIRIDAQVEHPSERGGFRHPELQAYAAENRGRLIAAACTMIQAWIFAGRPPMKVQPPSRFSAWARVVGGILEHAGIGGFLANSKELRRSADVAREALRAFVSDWAHAYGEHDVAAKELLPLALSAGVDLGYGEEASKLSKLGKSVLSVNEDRIFDGHRIDRRDRLWGLVCVSASQSEPTDEGSAGFEGSAGATHVESQGIISSSRLRVSLANPTDPTDPAEETSEKARPGERRSPQPTNGLGRKI